MKDAFKDFGCFEGSKKWEQAIKRENPIYSRNDVRSEFERDYTRILHCQAYRRLKHKTQVFFAPHNDHVCTRMEHVMHVASVAKTIAKYLGLNEQLAEAIALGHDIGHAPFGHHGEDCLNGLMEQKEGMNAPKKFWHERNSLFFADYIETLPDPDAVEQPLNLTYAVRDGLVCHCGEIDQQGIKPREDAIDLYSIKRPGIIQPFTWEGCVVKIADKIAYINHDIDDAVRSGVISIDDVPKSSLELFGYSHRQRIDAMVNDVIENSEGKDEIMQSEEFRKELLTLRSFMFKNVYKSSLVKKEEDLAKVGVVIKALYDYFLEHEEKLPEDLQEVARTEGINEAVKDFVAGMTDRYALSLYTDLFVPKAWK